MAQNLYDLTLLLDADAPEERRTAAVSEVHKLVGAGGELIGEHEWGVRRMAYEIDHHAEAEYRLYQFKAEPELLERLRHSLKIMDGVLRFRIIRLRPGSPPPPAPRDLAPRPREEREPEGRVAARAAADAPAPGEEGVLADAPPPEAEPAGGEAPSASEAPVATEEPEPAAPAETAPEPTEEPAEPAPPADA